MFFASNKSFLKFMYNALLTGMPSLMNNPINKNILHAPFLVNEGSTYINFKLNNLQINTINEFLETKKNGLIMKKCKLYNDNIEDYFLSINIYNCSSPLFNFISNEPVTRCEINIYVEDEYGEKGTLILDYESNLLSLDPENLFKKAGNVNFVKDYEFIVGKVISNNFLLDFNYNQYLNINTENSLGTQLIKFTDKIYYNNGLYDKLYYDSSLIHNKIIDCNDYNVYFKFLNMEFTNTYSLFYFEEPIDFVGGMWNNLYS
jgi:hypothetical protein